MRRMWADGIHPVKEGGEEGVGFDVDQKLEIDREPKEKKREPL